MKPEQDAKGRFIPGNNGGNGRPRGARGKLGEDFLEALHANFLAHGADAIDVVRIEKPDAYLKGASNNHEVRRFDRHCGPLPGG